MLNFRFLLNSLHTVFELLESPIVKMPLELAPEIGIEKDQDSASSAPPSQIVVSLGKQILGEYTNCQNLPSSPEELEQYMLHAAKLMGATIVSSVFHKFNPTGLSGVVVIAESHFAIQEFFLWKLRE